MNKLEISKESETKLKIEFEASRDLFGKSDLTTVETFAHLRALKTPTAATSNAETESKSFKTPSRVTMFLCPRAPSCSFSLSKAEMRTRNLPLDHLIQVVLFCFSKEIFPNKNLIQEHDIRPVDITPGQFKFSKKYI